VALLKLTCPNGHDFDLTLFNFPVGERITIAEPIPIECPTCDTRTIVAEGSYNVRHGVVVHTPPHGT
jgi:hypothetical protein